MVKMCLRSRTALVYDFDGTLAPGNMQEHSLLPKYLGVTKEAFWESVGADKKAHDSDQILIYRQHDPIAKTAPRGQGASEERAERTGVREHAPERATRHSGMRSKQVGRADGQAIWPGSVVNYTTKTQFLFRINKGVDTYWDDERVNRWVPMADRHIPFSRIIYIGDGDTDIPSMKMVRHQGGYSIAVFDPELWARGEAQKRAYNLIAEDRAHFVVPADYTDGSQLDVTVKGVLGRIARDAGWRDERR